VGGGMEWLFCQLWLFLIKSNIGFYLSAKVSFICNPCLLRLYIWKRWSALSNFPLFSVWRTSNVLSIVSYEWPKFKICSAYFEFCLSVLMAWMCSLYLVRKVRPVSPTYLSGQSLHLSWYMPLLLYIYICSSILNDF
jgi:hypothetical protein